MHLGIIVNAPDVYRYPKSRYSRKHQTSSIDGMPDNHSESQKPLKQYLGGSFREILAFHEVLEREHTCDIVLLHRTRFISAEDILTPRLFHEGIFSDFDVHLWLTELDAVIIIVPSNQIPIFLDHFSDEVTRRAFIVAGNDAYSKISKTFINSIHLIRRGVAKIDHQNREKIMKHLEMITNG